jgi:hypothetical protein
MKVDFIRDDKARRVTVAVQGAFDDAAWRSGITDRLSREALWSYGLIFDLRLMSDNIAEVNVREIASSGLAGPLTAERGPVAIVASGNTTYGKACAFVAVAPALMIDVFHSMADASAWLQSQSQGRHSTQRVDE